MHTHIMHRSERGGHHEKILALMGAVLLLSVSARAVEVSAPSAVLMEKETGTVLFAKNEHEKLEPASVTKL